MPDEPQAKRICLFGGTFDPIHLAHLRIANEALKTFALDQVLFIPGANPPHKASETVTPYEDRFHMVEIACAPYSSFVPSRLESGPELSYTIDTLDRVRSQLTPGDSLYFLIGSDAFDELQTWMRWEDVVKLTDFIVVSRPGRQYQIPDGARVHRLDGLELPISSSEVRARLSRGESPA
ncbi:MAG: nicotinate (nicotinamide) nucleotide adenylyltransferase, partial [Acidobacteriaceae bacterium]|nr:nicotinate (nicotinamide) nucleotide adenylyltransferase [Acidobacteriaceae bacterium]